MKKCPYCMEDVHEDAIKCKHCFEIIKEYPVSKKKRLVALVLCLFLGTFGIHRFYVGKTFTGLIWMLSLGLLGLGTFLDIIMIIVGTFKDKDGMSLESWT